MGRVIDTSIFIADERGTFDLGHYLEASPDDENVIATITAAELLVGVHLASTRKKPSRTENVHSILAQFQPIAFNLLIAEVHAQFASKLQRAGKAVGTHDLIIAATAVSLDFEVLTLDRRSFPRIPGVRLAQISI